MMIQATVPTAFGLFWTPWLLDTPLLVAAGITAIAVAIMFAFFRSGRISRRLLAAMMLLYLVFAALLVSFHLADRGAGRGVPVAALASPPART